MGYLKTKDDSLDSLLLEFFGAEFFNPNHDEVQEYFIPFNTSLKDNKCKVITIAGTNGKGQTAHFMNDYLISKGFACALWTSPHVLSVTERFKFGGQDISHDELLDTFNRSYSKNLKVSYYEFLFYCFLILCEKRELDYIILEVGLGGRLDAVNYIDADFSLLTSISRDHEEFLGSDLEGILAEKLGVCRKNSPHFSSLEASSLRLKQRELLGEGHKVSDLFEAKVILSSDNYFVRNRLLAIFGTHKILGLPTGRNELLRVSNAFRCTVTKGRQEEVTINNIKFIFVGAHNVDGIEKMRDYFLSEDSLDKGSILCAFSNRKSEDIISSLEILKSPSSLWKSIFVTSFEHGRALPFESIPLVEGISILDDWKGFVDNLINDKKGQWIVTGSYYFIGEVQKYLNSRFSFL